ncbi:MAG: 3-phosphoshikimate 1-carboxyvinyltransferase [Flavobacteriales bacterium]|jgi:3-phosphoshikimate 1-carboxyvinyltransferase|nr:3-phosphoshikimate 1-carboxyvinyltransferase [Flavobacteriales bacterium]
MKLLAPNGPLIGEVELPISKSIANRYQIISALAKQSLSLGNSLPNDVKVLRDALNSNQSEINIGMAGTAMRFLAAYYSVQEGKEVLLTGDHRMKQRPIAELVDGLKKLGAEIEYVEQQGFPPLRIIGKKLLGGEIEISASVSSQFISALMMIGPKMQNGLTLKLNGKVLSKPYIQLTADCMESCGAQLKMDADSIHISRGNYSVPELNIEADWSAASYFYAFAAAKPNSKLLLKGLKLNSSQGDSAIADWFEKMGISSIQTENGVEFSSSEELNFPTELDFTANPDLAQTFAFLAATLGKTLNLTGLDNLRLKETDRVSALQTELEKLGLNVSVDGNSMTVSGSISVAKAKVKTYNDHRMAMSATVGAYGNTPNSKQGNTPTIEIENPQVVEKSFPTFWSELQQLTFKIDE